MEEQVVPLREYRQFLPAPPAVLAILALHLVGDYFAIPTLTSFELSDRAEGFVVCGLYGAMMGQLAMIVAYQAWGRDNWLRRWAKSLFLMVLVWAAYSAGANSSGNSFEVSSIAQLFAVVFVGTFLCLAVPVWGARLLVGLRFTLARAESDAQPGGGMQFHLRDLMAGTLGAAIVLGILTSPAGRELVGRDWSFSWQEVGGLAVFLSLMTALGAFAAIPTAWFAMGKHGWDEALAAFVAYLIALVVVEIYVYYAFIDRDSNGWLLVISLNAGVVAQVLFTAFLLRARGYRLRLRGN